MHSPRVHNQLLVPENEKAITRWMMALCLAKCVATSSGSQWLRASNGGGSGRRREDRRGVHHEASNLVPQMER
jgi:hypothetical protein